ncbi:MAG: carboxypeptidase M32 [Candidatus Heimdallarchaeota archaeon]|nr:MAG: carboxypeptidase M32 [Candidatus Heimdallarchaeota archaeon]
MEIQENYKTLLKEYHNYNVLNQIDGILYWDFETKMPSEGVAQRSEQSALLATLMHEQLTKPKIGELLHAIKSDPAFDSFNDVEKRNVILIEREYNRKTKIPKDLVEKLAKQSKVTSSAWKKAKNQANYALFQPEFTKLLELVKERVKYLNPDKEPFDVLLDEYEPGMSSAQLTTLFNEVKNGIFPIIQRCMSSLRQPDLSLIEGKERECSLQIQKKLADELAKMVYYDLDKGRIDESEHPFTVGYYDDVRITTHYYENDFSSSFFSVLHEAGHGIYEQYLPKEYIYQPVGDSVSSGLHESQSRFIENLLGRSPEFWEYYLPCLKELTGDIFADVELESFIRAINKVEPSKIRIEADEVTYSLHVIIRFEIERDLLTGKISPNDLPTIWNQKYKEYLGVDIENDAEGVLQDIHWSEYDGFGIFPGYVLGNIYNAQMLAKLSKDIPDYKGSIKKGEFKPIIDWLIENVHQHANLYDPPELVKKITGETINPKYFIKYLEEKYSKIYGF